MKPTLENCFNLYCSTNKCCFKNKGIERQRNKDDYSIRDRSKSIGGGGGPEQRGGKSSIFEPLVRGGSFNF